jgi:hypothetical protein
VTSLFAFPNPVNEKAARVVAGTVCALSVVALATGSYGCRLFSGLMRAGLIPQSVCAECADLALGGRQG